jgi:hypothetical protein
MIHIFSHENPLPRLLDSLRHPAAILKQQKCELPLKNIPPTKYISYNGDPEERVSKARETRVLH